MSARPLPVAGAALWRASELATPDDPVLSSGHAALDSALPGGGWPLGPLIDLLQPVAGRHEWRLLLPALRAVQGTTVLVGPPHPPHLPALAAQGLDPGRLLHIAADSPAERLWVAEQALGCHALGALLVWLPQAPAAALRRLHLCPRASGSARQPPPLVLALRPLAQRHQACAAPLRLALDSAGRHGLQVELLKRRGPPLAAPLRLTAPLPVLACLRPATSSPADRHVVDRLRHAPLAA